MFSRFSSMSILFFAPVLSVSVADAEISQSPNNDPVEKCRTLIENKKDSTEFEVKCASSLSGIVENGDGLVRVRLKNGLIKSFKDTDISCMNSSSKKDCIIYRIGDYFWKNELVVVNRWLDIGPSSFQVGSYMIDRDTGRIIDLPDGPHFSPDGTRFVALSVCYDHCPNRIDVWSVKDGPAKLEWRHRVKQGEDSYYYEFLGWQNNERINLRIYPEKPAEGDAGRDIDKNKYSDAWVYFDGLAWKIEKSTQGNQIQGPGRVGQPKN